MLCGAPPRGRPQPGDRRLRAERDVHPRRVRPGPPGARPPHPGRPRSELPGRSGHRVPAGRTPLPDPEPRDRPGAGLGDIRDHRPLAPRRGDQDHDHAGRAHLACPQGLVGPGLGPVLRVGGGAGVQARRPSGDLGSLRAGPAGLRVAALDRWPAPVGAGSGGGRAHHAPSGGRHVRPAGVHGLPARRSGRSRRHLRRRPSRHCSGVLHHAAVHQGTPHCAAPLRGGLRELRARKRRRPRFHPVLQRGQQLAAGQSRGSARCSTPST